MRSSLNHLPIALRGRQINNSGNQKINGICKLTKTMPITQNRQVKLIPINRIYTSTSTEAGSLACF